MSPLILIDNTDPNIQYSPGWTNMIVSLDSTDGNYPMYGTLQETVTQAELSYSFIGKFVVIYGLITGTSKQSFSWDCFIDNVPVDGASITGPGGQFTFCDTQVSLPEGQHEIRLSVNASQSLSFSFDYLLYTPSSAISSADLFLTSDNPSFKYGNGWEPVTSSTGALNPLANTNHLSALGSAPGMETMVIGSQFTFDFYGVSVLWLGFYNTTFASPNYGNSAFTYSVDGEPPMEGYLLREFAQGLKFEGSVETFHLFQTFAYPRGQHTLEVVFKGLDDGGPTNSTIPLTLTGLVVQNGTSTMSQTSSPIITSGGMKGAPRAHLAVILGSCFGVVLVVVTLTILFVCYKKKRRGYVSADSITPTRVEPFSHDPTSSPGPYQKGQNFPQRREERELEPSEIGAPPSYLTRRSSI